tara:strand:- start:206 stop:397 length:192 start_codon:yes stop_codon:yes gene_type:complete
MARFKVTFAPYDTHRWLTEVEVDDPNNAEAAAYDELRFDIGHDSAKDYECVSVEPLDDEECIE